jgi:hypothetical protein
MFCTQCGNQIERGKNFCRKCGARVANAAQPTPDSSPSILETLPSKPVIEPRMPTVSAPTRIRDAEATAAPTRHSDRSLDKPAIIIAGVVVVLIMLGAGVYFGTDLLRQAPQQQAVVDALVPPPAAPELPQAETAPPPSETKESNLWEPIQPAPAGPQPPVQVEPRVPAPPAPAQPVAPNEALPPPAGGPRDRGKLNRPVPPPPAQARLTPSAGTYETIRSTTVFAQPSTSSKIVSNIDRGIRVNVVASNAEWLELRSRFGNPPGYIRREHTRPLGRADQ